MLFPTLSFFLFFLVVLTLFWSIAFSNSARLGYILTASYIFYAAWDIRFCALIACCSIMSWIGAHYGPNSRHIRIFCITALVLILGFFKYFDFFSHEFARLFAPFGLFQEAIITDIILPVGISFYIFQGISLIIDETNPTKSVRPSLLETSAFLSFFPQLVAGPIVRAHELIPQLRGYPTLCSKDIMRAGELILLGLLKKLIIANYLAQNVVDPIWQVGPQGMWEAWIAMFAYGIQIFCDFSGYSDLAIGFALLLGYRLPQNFSAPYAAKSLTEFWRRWHMTLSRFIRDYIYIPMGGSHHSTVRTASHLIFAMMLAGLWHGANWTFVIWGLLHGVLLALTRSTQIGVLATYLSVNLLWILFRAPDLSTAFDYYAAMLTAGNFPNFPLYIYALTILGAFLAVIPPKDSVIYGYDFWKKRPYAHLWLTGLTIWVLFALAPPGVAPFIYFQF